MSSPTSVLDGNELSHQTLTDADGVTMMELDDDNSDKDCLLVDLRAFNPDEIDRAHQVVESCRRPDYIRSVAISMGNSSWSYPCQTYSSIVVKLMEQSSRYLAAIGRLPQLHTLSLSAAMPFDAFPMDTAVLADSVLVACRHRLQQLNLTSIRWFGSMDDLTRAFGATPALTSVCLRSCSCVHWEETKVAQCWQALSQMPHLQELRLESMRLSCAAQGVALSLLDAWATSSSLQHLQIRECAGLDKEHLLHLLAGLGNDDSTTTQSSLKSLHIRLKSAQCEDQEDILRGMANMLRSNATLESLSYSAVGGQEQVQHVIRALQGNHTLKVFQFRTTTDPPTTSRNNANQRNPLVAPNLLVPPQLQPVAAGVEPQQFQGEANNDNRYIFNSDDIATSAMNLLESILHNDNKRLETFHVSGWTPLPPRIQFYLKLNQAGRHYLLEEDDVATRDEWIQVLIQHCHDTSLVLYFLLKNPSLLISSDEATTTRTTTTHRATMAME